tara:strand:- start:16820 stop:17566 length:747 start_codon:yes stop_codon:yes gene_type:complete
MFLDDERNKQNQISLANQRITRRDRADNRFVKNLEKQALRQSSGSRRSREIRGLADEMRQIVQMRTSEERGKLEEGIIYDSKQYSQPTFNSQETNKKATDQEGVDTISSEDTPGNSQGGASGGAPNDNSTPTTDPNDPDDPNAPVGPNDWFNYDFDGDGDLGIGAPNARGTVSAVRINYSGMVFKPDEEGGGFVIETPGGVQKIQLFMQDMNNGFQADEPAKFREFDVCKDGALATVHILSTAPLVTP